MNDVMQRIMLLLRSSGNSTPVRLCGVRVYSGAAVPCRAAAGSTQVTCRMAVLLACRTPSPP